MAVLLERAVGLGKHVMVAGVDADNGSRSGCTSGSGSTARGRCTRGCKFGRWLDLTFLERQLDDRASPPPALPGR